MSCEARHHDIVARLLSLAGLHDTDADTVMGVGVANRRRRGELPTPDAAVPVPLHADAQQTLEITGHSDQATPSWVGALVDLLYRAANRGNRRALLTLRWLTEGWQAITSSLTLRDRGWLLAATCCGIRIPQAWEAWITRPRPAAMGRLFAYPVTEAVMYTEILDGLAGIDSVSPETTKGVTPLHVLRFLLGGSFPSRTDLQQVLRAVLDGAPAVHDIVTLVVTLWKSGRIPYYPLPFILRGSAGRGQGCTVEQAGIDAVLEDVADKTYQVTGRSTEPTALRDPSPEVVQTIITLLQNEWYGSVYLHHPSLTILMHCWQTGGRNDVIEQVVQTLIQAVSSHAFPAIIAPIVAGVVHPPHGDALVARLEAYSTREDAWLVMAAGAVYAARCQQVGHGCSVRGRDDLIRIRWGNRPFTDYPSSIPLLAVGQEHELLLPVIHTERNPDRWLRMLLDVIDAVDMLDAVGGDPQALHAVITEGVTMRGDTLDPRIVVRLAASRLGQAILDKFPVTTVPPIQNCNDMDMYRHVLPHLVSPGWATAPPHLREWWEQACRQIAVSKKQSFRLDNPPLLYPTVIPQVAVFHSTDVLATRAVAGSQWDDLPETDRRACIDRAFSRTSLVVAIGALSRAATTVARQDIAAVLDDERRLSETYRRFIRQLIVDDPWRSA